MTERRSPEAGPGTRRARRSQWPPALAWGGSAVAFAVVLVLLAWQVASGSDPAIGKGPEVAVEPAAKRVLVRRIVRRVVVTHEAAAAPASSRARASAPAAATAAPAQAPAPPTPAAPPPTTRSS
jgi:hypothetical protein